jgi:serine/threonine-protein kinase HipA
MRQLAIYRNGILAGILTEEHRQYYQFKYDDNYLLSSENQVISLTLPILRHIVLYVCVKYFETKK